MPASKLTRTQVRTLREIDAGHVVFAYPRYRSTISPLEVWDSVVRLLIDIGLATPTEFSKAITVELTPAGRVLLGEQEP